MEVLTVCWLTLTASHLFYPQAVRFSPWRPVQFLSDTSQCSAIYHGSCKRFAAIRFPPQNVCTPPKLPTTPPLHSSLFDHPKIFFGGEVMKLLIMYFSPFSCYFLPLASHILVIALFSNTVTLTTSFNAKDQVSHPCEIIRKLCYRKLNCYIFRKKNGMKKCSIGEKYEMNRLKNFLYTLCN